MIRELVPGRLWVVEQPMPKGGIDVGARMTVLGLPDGLWVHSPLDRTPEVAQWLEKTGVVRWIVSPSRFHYLCVPEYARAYPEAEVYAAPGSARRLRGVRIAGLLDGSPPAAWAGELDQTAVRGSRLYDEVVFYDPRSRTAIATDLLFNIPETAAPATRLFAWMMGILGRPAASRSFGWTVRDRAEIRRSLRAIRAWEFDRLILSHGEVVDQGAKAAFEKAFAPYLADQADQ